jgi:hypothetical protein
LPPETLDTRAPFPFRRRHTRERGRSRGGAGAARGEERCHAPELHRAGAPIVYTGEPALPGPASPRHGIASQPHRALSPFSPAGEDRRRRSFPSLSAAGDAEEPSVANPRHPFPSSRRAVFCAGARRAAILSRCRRRPTAAASCRGPGMPVPRARHGHATALGSQAPRACVRTRAARPSRVPASPRPC